MKCRQGLSIFGTTRPYTEDFTAKHLSEYKVCFRRVTRQTDFFLSFFLSIFFLFFFIYKKSFWILFFFFLFSSFSSFFFHFLLLTLNNAFFSVFLLLFLFNPCFIPNNLCLLSPLKRTYSPNQHSPSHQLSSPPSLLSSHGLLTLTRSCLIPPIYQEPNRFTRLPVHTTNLFYPRINLRQ